MEKPIVVIHIEGGAVQDIICNGAVVVHVLDSDIEDSPNFIEYLGGQDVAVMTHDFDGGQAEANKKIAEIDSAIGWRT